MADPIPLSVRKLTRRGVYSVHHQKTSPWKNFGANGIVAGNNANPVNGVDPTGNAIIKTNYRNNTYEIRPWTTMDAASLTVANLVATKTLWSSVLMATVVDGSNARDASISAGEKAGKLYDAEVAMDGGAKVMEPLFKWFGRLFNFTNVVDDISNADTDGFNTYWEDNLKGFEFKRKEDAINAVKQYYKDNPDNAPANQVINEED